MVPRPEDLQIETPASKDPFAIAARPIGSLLQFAPQQTYGHRVKVVSTITYNSPGRSGRLSPGRRTGAWQKSRPGKPNALQLGDQVEVLGFVSEGDYTPVTLQDATFQKEFPPPSPAARPGGIDDWMKC